MASAAVLCGGLARRFGGRAKWELVVDGQTILHRQITTLSAVGSIDEVLLVGGSAAHPAARSVRDHVPGLGPLSGIHAALTEARADTVLVLACDMPYISAALATYLIECAQEAEVVVPWAGNRYHPLCAVYTRSCLKPISMRLAERRLKIQDLLGDLRHRVVTDRELERFGEPHRLLQNVNTPVEYAALRNSRDNQL
jgi:molybdopterin-guanine dinucleotide biosynthesis protein A